MFSVIRLVGDLAFKGRSVERLLFSICLAAWAHVSGVLFTESVARGVDVETPVLVPTVLCHRYTEQGALLGCLCRDRF